MRISLVGIVAIRVFVEYAHPVYHLVLQRHIVLHLPHLSHLPTHLPHLSHIVGRCLVDLLIEYLSHDVEWIEAVVAVGVVQRWIQVIVVLVVTGRLLIEVGGGLIEVGGWLEVPPAVVCIQISPLVLHLVAHIIGIHLRGRLHAVRIYLRIKVVAPLRILHRLASPSSVLPPGIDGLHAWEYIGHRVGLDGKVIIIGVGA